jgi:hypothetical protein
MALSDGVSFACCLLFVLMDLPLAKCIRSLSMRLPAADDGDGAGQRRVMLAAFTPEPCPRRGAL